MLRVVVDKQARAEVTSGMDELFRVIMQDGGLTIPRPFPDRPICMAQEGEVSVSSRPEVFECACCEQPLTGGFVRLWPPTNIRVCYGCIDWMNSQRDLQVERAGGPVRVVGHEPVFRVIDIARAVEHYRRLGFRTEYHDESYAFAHLGNLTVHLAHDEHPEQHMTSVLYLHVEDADRLAGDWRAAGATVAGPRNEDYGKREGQHVDPDGNLIRFGSPIPR